MIEGVKQFFIGNAHAAATFNFFGFNTVDTNVTDANSTVNTLVGNVVTWVLVAAGVVAFIYLIISGINYITAGGDSAKATTARQGIINAVIGIVIVVLAWVIVTFAFQLGNQIGNGVS